jgi:hypothetical protein
MDLTSYSSTQQAPAGVKLAGRFVPPAEHASLLDPTASPATTVEMQKQFASFIATLGTTVVVNDASTMVPEVPVVTQSVSDLNEKSKSKKGKNGKAKKPPNRIESRPIPNRLNDID